MFAWPKTIIFVSIDSDQSFEFSVLVPLLKILRFVSTIFPNTYISRSTKSAIVYLPIASPLHRQYSTATATTTASTKRIRITMKPEVERLGLQKV